VDWQALRAAADEVAGKAYAPYSRLRVGAAGLCADGRVVAGCNVENASYGLTLCAECGLVSAAVAAGAGPLVAVSVTAGDGRSLAPCGRCRQLLLEHGSAGLLVDGGPDAPPRALGDLLPSAFDEAELGARRSAGPSGPRGSS
jgi:cytidine deaminase